MQTAPACSSCRLPKRLSQTPASGPGSAAGTLSRAKDTSSAHYGTAPKRKAHCTQAFQHPGKGDKSIQTILATPQHVTQSCTTALLKVHKVTPRRSAASRSFPLAQSSALTAEEVPAHQYSSTGTAGDHISSIFSLIVRFLLFFLKKTKHFHTSSHLPVGLCS